MSRQTLKIAVSLGIIFLSGLAMPATGWAESPPMVSPLVYEADGIQEYQLKNGMKVLLVPNHAAPVATLMVIYRVGSRNEAVGYTGSTHFLEHMLFKGTPAFNKNKGTQIANLLLREGARFNATTWLDRTNYFETLPSDKLELAMQIESDRMRNSFISDEDRQSEMTVVRNELERGENEPASVMWDQMFSQAFISHPYHHPTIGWRSDVEGVPTERLKKFYQDFYYPNNATLIVVGDIEVPQTLAMAEKYFGKIGSSPQAIPQVYTEEPPQEGERRFTIKRPGQLGIVNMGFHVPPLENKNSYALDLLDNILSNGVTSRLYQALVEKQLATHTYSANIQLRDPGLFILNATVASGISHEQVEKTMLAVLEDLKKKPPTVTELTKAKNQIKADFSYRRHGTSQLASTLGEYEATANWRYMVTYLEHLEKVTPQDIQQVLQTYFKVDNRTIGYFIPEKSDKVVVNTRTPEIYTHNQASKSTITKKEGKTAIQRYPFSKNAILLVQENHLDNTVAIQGSIRAGAINDPVEHPGLAELTAQMLNKGTKKHNKLELAEKLDSMGSTISFSADLENASFSVRTLSENIEKTLSLLFEMLNEVVFSKEELEKLKKQRVDQLKQELEDTDNMASQLLYQSLYPKGHPYYHRAIEDLIKATEATTIQDIQKFYRQHYGSNKMILAAVGDVDAQDIKKRVSSHLDKWNPTNPAAIVIKDVPLQAKGKQVIHKMKDKANVSIALGHQADVKLSSPDYFPAMLANHALGRSTLTSRLGLRVRDELGLTYGIFSYFPQASIGSGPWIIGVTTNPKNVEQVLTEAKAVVEKYRKEGITERELNDAKSSMIGSYLVSLATNPQIADRLVQVEFYNLGLDYFQKRAALIRKVSQQQVNEAIRKYFHPDRLTTSIAGTL